MTIEDAKGGLAARAVSATVHQKNSHDLAKRMHVLALGGAHQFAHVLPVACALEKRYPGQVRFFVCTEPEAQIVREQVASMGAVLPEVVVMTLPVWAKALPAKAHKIARLLIWGKRLCAGDVLLSAERTSTILRKLFRDCPPLLHIPHGAGDRAVGFEKRFTLFDHVLVAGNKDRDRLIDSGFVAPERCSVTGPVKLASVVAQMEKRAPLFDNERPTLLYNPHFSAKFSSLPAFGERLVAAVLDDGRYNLVVAPHVRMAKEWSYAQKQMWQALSVPDRVVIDLGSPRCIDMTYTLGAALYIGDVSSQVYEFLVQPRPCVFVDAHAANWQDNEDYAMWHFGEVISPNVEPIVAIDRAFTNHKDYVARQQERMVYSMDGLTWGDDGTPSFMGRDVAGDAGQYVARYAGLT